MLATFFCISDVLSLHVMLFFMSRMSKVPCVMQLLHFLLSATAHFNLHSLHSVARVHVY